MTRPSSNRPTRRETSGAKSGRGGGIPSLRILIAEDESIIRLGLRRMLTDLGHEVVAAVADGVSAVEMARETHPDLAILDIRMPRMDGLEAARRMVEERPLPIILLTAYSDRETVDRARAAPVLAYLVKPLREEELEPTIALALARFEEQQALAAERKSLEEALETRDLVEEAKRLLMAREGLTEAEAFRRIHLQSRSQRRPMRAVAQEIIAGSGASKTS